MSALLLYDLGYAIIPCEYRTKKPLITGWPSYYANGAPPRKTVEEWTSRPHNVAILLGKPSGVVAIDYDDPALAEEALQQYGALPTPIVRSGRGVHFYFKYIPDIPHCEFLPKVEFRTDGDLLMVPPSVHPSGRPYVWLHAPWDVQPMPMPTALLELVRKHLAPPPVVHIEIPEEPPDALRPLRAPEARLNFEEIGIYWPDFYTPFLGSCRGSREWRSARCPFHDDFRESFSFSSRHGGWRCHAGCGHGTPIDFLMRYHDITYHEARNLLLATIEGA